MKVRELAPRTARSSALGTFPSWLAALLLALPAGALAHGLIVDPPARNAFCGYITKPDQVNNGVAQYPVCGNAFNAPGLDPNIAYNFMAVLTHDQGYAVVGARDNVCGFDAEPFGGKATPWDQPIDWPTNAVSAGPITLTWNISWGPHFSDTQEFRYWITNSNFVWQLGKPLSFSDFEATNFCYLPYDDTNPSGNPAVIPDKTAATFKTKCTLPARSGHHVIYAEWGRNSWTYERFHGCVDVVFGGTTSSYTLGVTRAGTGSGTVTSSAGGISCGTSCSATLAPGATVTLTAAAATGSSFAGWGGVCSGSAPTCTVTMSASATATATFNTSTGTTFALTATRNGTGGGTVLSTPAGISCGTSCSASFAAGTVVTLVGDVAAGSTFAGWGGACTGTGPCTVTMSQARAVTATFNTTSGTMYTLTVTSAGTGAGTVTSTPAGITCGSTCSATFNSGSSVTLGAAAATGSTFTGWSGACTGAGSCIVSMTAASAVTATFAGATSGAPCASPVTFTNQSGNFNTAGAVCLRTSAAVNGWNCSNFQGRTVSVNGGAATSTCGAGPFPLPRSSDGYTYFSVSAGTYTWASLATW